MKEFDVKEVGENDYTFTNKDNGDVYNVHLNHYGNPDVHRVDSSRGGNLLGLFLLLWVALIFVMPVIFFTEKIYAMDSAPILFIVAYLFILGAFIFTFIPSVKKIKIGKFKKYGLLCLYIFNYLLLIFSTIVYFTQTKENSLFIFIYIMPVVCYLLILYHVKDFHIIPKVMARFKIKKYSFILVYFLQWLIICAIFYYLILVNFKDFLGDYAAFILCYMYMIYVDIKKILFCKGEDLFL